jgi:catechol 2,3-dioxygenase-like lactoylglutathione lyase family enzyme
VLEGRSYLREHPEHVRIGSIVIRCHEFERMLDFWQAALGYVIGHSDEGFVILKDPEGKGPNISLDRSLVKRTGRRSWLHLDLYTTDQTGEVERLVALCARRYRWRYEPDADYVVLEDPDRNLFCVVQV